MKHSAGIALIYNEKLLVVHATGAPWKGMYGIPKGGIEENEQIHEAAAREVFEEVGFKINPNKLKEVLQQDIFYTNKKGRRYKRLSFFEYHVADSELLDMGIKDAAKLVIPKSKLQLSEVDWAGFMSKESLKKNMLPNQYKLVEYLNFK